MELLISNNEKINVMKIENQRAIFMSKQFIIPLLWGQNEVSYIWVQHAKMNA